MTAVSAYGAVFEGEPGANGPRFIPSAPAPRHSIAGVSASMTSVLLIGMGRWGSNHFRVLRSLRVDLWCADADPSKREKLVEAGLPAERFSTDPLAFVDRIDCAVIATPAQAHFAQAKALLEAGKDVLVEKPLTLEPAESVELVRIAEERGRILQVGHIFRFDPASEWLRGAIARGSFGRLKMLRGEFSGFKRPRTDSGVTFADSIHFVDLFNYLVGAPPARVTGQMQDFLGRGMEDESWLSMSWDLDGGAPLWGTVETGYHAPGKTRQIVVAGDKLSAICDFNIAQYKVRTFEARHEVVTDGAAAIEGDTRQLEFPSVEPLLAEVSAFLDCVEKRTPPVADGRSAYWAVEVVRTALRSAEEGRTLPVTYAI